MAELHSSIIALVSLASGIASNHPSMGQCQVARLRKMGISEEQIASVIEIARHIRGEVGEKRDLAFDEATYPTETIVSDKQLEESSSTGTCCSSTASGQSCC